MKGSIAGLVSQKSAFSQRKSQLGQPLVGLNCLVLPSLRRRI